MNKRDRVVLTIGVIDVLFFSLVQNLLLYKNVIFRGKTHNIYHLIVVGIFLLCICYGIYTIVRNKTRKKLGQRIVLVISTIFCSGFFILLTQDTINLKENIEIIDGTSYVANLREANNTLSVPLFYHEIVNEYFVVKEHSFIRIR